VPIIIQDKDLVLSNTDGRGSQINFSQSLQLVGQEVESDEVLLVKTQEI
jgi:hypothetical protein